MTEDGLLIEMLPARLCMPLDTYVEGGVLHFVSRGLLFSPRRGISALAAALLSPGVTHVEHIDLGHGWFRFTMTVTHPLGGEVLFPDRSLLRRGGVAMTLVFSLLTVQTLLGALDTLWNHELVERLPSRRAARVELALHAAREFVYVFLFLALAWREWHGAWARGHRRGPAAGSRRSPPPTS